MARILMVEDEEVMALITELALRQAGHDPVRAVDGQDGLDKYRAAPSSFDAIVSDVNMPNMDGITMTRNLRTEGFITPIIIVTKQDAPSYFAQVRQEALEAGADAVVDKAPPNDKPSYAQTLNTALNEYLKPSPPLPTLAP